MSTIDILTVMDPLGFQDNNLPLTTPITQIPMVSTQTLTNNVWMLAEQQSVVRGQGTWDLTIKASPMDSLRWWDTSVVQDTQEDMIIVGFSPSDNWDSVLSIPEAKTQGCGIAYIKSGFDFNSLSQLQFALNGFQNNYIYATIKDNAQKDLMVRYYLIVAKLDVHDIGAGPRLKGLYRFDPGITIV